MSAEAAADVDPFLAMGRRILATQPFSVLIGAELEALGQGSCELGLAITPQLKQHNGFAHGGVVSYLADNAITFAAGSALQVPVVTSEYKINYLRPAVGERLLARARTVHVGKSQAVCQCEIVVVAGGAEKVCAVAQGTIVRLAGAAADGAPALRSTP